MVSANLNKHFIVLIMIMVGLVITLIQAAVRAADLLVVQVTEEVAAAEEVVAVAVAAAVAVEVAVAEDKKGCGMY